MSTDDVAKHLEFLGYELDTSEGLFARHERYPNLRVLEKNGGYLLVAWFGTQGELADKLSFVNAVNQEAIACRFVIDKDQDFAMEGWYPVEYERTAFARFMEMWHRDWTLVVAHPAAQEILK